MTIPSQAAADLAPTPPRHVDPAAAALLELKLVGDIAGRFFVARYQRGYRWGEPEVRRLLQDIWDSKGAPYSLQPVVVKRLREGEWELVDGQQRKPLTGGLGAGGERLRMMTAWRKRSSCSARAVEHGEALRSGRQRQRGGARADSRRTSTRSRMVFTRGR